MINCFLYNKPQTPNTLIDVNDARTILTKLNKENRKENKFNFEIYFPL